MHYRRGLASVGLTLGLVACQSAWAQRPVVPICSDKPEYKLPPCKASGGDGQATPQPGDVSPAVPATPFPFPGDAAPASTPAVSQFPFPGSDTPQPAQQGRPSTTPATAPKPAAGQFPFPGEDVPLPVLDPHEKVYDPSEGKAGPPAPKANANRQAPDDAGSSSSSSSSSSPDASPDTDASPLKDRGSEGSTPSERRRLPKVEVMGAREEEDLKVAKYYHSTGNYMAAYLRAKDALKIDPTDPEAHLLMAINAQKLAKKDEAIDGYTTYLKLLPGGDEAKTAERGLAALK